MVEHNHNTQGQDCEEWFYLSLQEVATSFGVQRETILEIIDEGIVTVHWQQSDMQFDNEALKKIRKVLQLERDLGVNLAGAGLVLELLQEIDRLHTLLAGKK